jgi:hypothetical protein
MLNSSWGFENWYDFDRFVVIFFLGNGDLDHILYIGDPLLLPLFLPPSNSVRTTPIALAQPGTGMGPYRGWHKVVPGDPSKRWAGLRVPSANRPVVQGRETVVVV